MGVIELVMESVDDGLLRLIRHRFQAPHSRQASGGEFHYALVGLLLKVGPYPVDELAQLPTQPKQELIHPANS